MRDNARRLALAAFLLAVAWPGVAAAQRQMEHLGRGVVAVNQGGGHVFISWRLLGTEPADTPFNLYRVTGSGQPVKLNSQPLAGATSYQDAGVDLTEDNTYFIRPVLGGVEGEASAPFLNRIDANSAPVAYREIPLNLPAETQAGDGSVGDLDGDGEYEIILKGVQRPRDTASRGLTGNSVLQAYRMDGTHLWTIQLGLNVREGEHDAQYMVYDLDGDGRAELVVRTADGTIDGTGKVIGDPNARWRDEDPESPTFGRIMQGPEYLTIFDGLTGAELVTTEYVPTRYPIDGWGGIGGSSGNDTNGNRVNRFLAAVVYLDGERPSVVMARGVYGRSVLVAYDWRNGQLTQRWIFDSSILGNNGYPYVTAGATVEASAPTRIVDDAGTWSGVDPGQWMVWDREGVQERRKVMAVDGNAVTVDEPVTPGQAKASHVWGYSGMGGHSLSVADVDGDGRDEIVYNAMVVDDDGTGLYTTGLRHGDALHVTDIDPSNPGLEVFGPHENEGHEWDRWTPAAALFDARTGRTLWDVDYGRDAGRGIVGDIDPRSPGMEVWGAVEGLRSATGEVLSSSSPGMTNFVVWWDGDLLREMVDGNRVGKWNWETGELEILFTADGARAAASTKNSPVVSADLFGDWREEIVLRAADNSALRIYTTTSPTSHRLPTLMHDPQYRVAIAWQNVTYNQPPWPSFFIGQDMADPPARDIREAGR